MSQLDDNLYPNDGAYFAPPAAQVAETDKEEGEVRSSAPALEKAIARLQLKAGFYESVNAIDSSVLTNPEEFMHVVAANKLAAQVLRDEAEYLEKLLEEYRLPQ